MDNLLPKLVSFILAVAVIATVGYYYGLEDEVIPEAADHDLKTGHEIFDLNGTERGTEAHDHERRNMDKKEKKALSDIETYGCHILHVLEEAEYPRFTYSIGIQKNTSQPEVIITGMKQELAHWLINEYNNRIKSGEKFEANKYYQGFLGNFDVTFKVVEKKHYPEYFGWARWLYKGDDFDVLQLICPTTSGKWPWDDEAPESFRRFFRDCMQIRMGLPRM